MKPLAPWEEVPFTGVKLNDAFWGPRIDVVKSVTLRACLDQCGQTGRISNFRKAAGLMKGEFEGSFCFNDSDVYKLIEGAAYILLHKRDEQLETELDQIIDWIVAAQEPDGYLDTYFTLKDPTNKWSDMYLHEMYCGGHLIEAATAYYAATGKRKLLDCACLLADHYDNLFGSDKRHWVTGHEEVELALVKLYRTTGEKRYLKLAEWLLDERGKGHGRGYIWNRLDWGAAYCQDDVPVREMDEVKGHAVRAMYLYTGIADVACMTGDSSYVPALERVWEHTVDRNLYVTGGIGPSRHNEGFTFDYDLPNETAYCETCAAIAMVFWNHRMNLLTRDAKYADIVEKEMYNGALSGLSLTGDTFFYVNPLASQGDHHRVEWFDCSCCPTNLVRYITSISNYIYAVSADGFIINQYINSSFEYRAASGNRAKITQKTDFPWQGHIKLEVDPIGVEHFALQLRIPGWCSSYSVSINHLPLSDHEVCFNKGYIVIQREWSKGDLIDLWLDMPVDTIRSHPKVMANMGRIAFQRGPLIYCLEQVDNPELRYDEFSIAGDSSIQMIVREDILNGIVELRGMTAEKKPFTLVPYYSWDNREPGFMQVWMKEFDRSALYQF